MLSTVHSFLQANFAFQSKPGSFGYVQNMGEKEGFSSPPSALTCGQLCIGDVAPVTELIAPSL